MREHTGSLCISYNLCESTIISTLKVITITVLLLKKLTPENYIISKREHKNYISHSYVRYFINLNIHSCSEIPLFILSCNYISFDVSEEMDVPGGIIYLRAFGLSNSST